MASGRRAAPRWRAHGLGVGLVALLAAPAAADEVLLLRQRVMMLEQQVRELNLERPQQIERLQRLEARLEGLRLELEALRAEVGALAGKSEAPAK